MGADHHKIPVAESGGAEPEEGELVARGFDAQGDREVEGEVGELALPGADQPHPLVELHDDGGVGQAVGPAGVDGSMGDGPAVEGAPAVGRGPHQVGVRSAARAPVARRVLVAIAARAVLEMQPTARGVPVEVDVRAVGHRDVTGVAHARPRMASDPSPKSPHPVTTPTSASGTWVAPPSPRSWRTASTTWFIPHMWPCESRPPWVFSG